MAGEINKLLKSIQRAWDEVEAFLNALSDDAINDVIYRQQKDMSLQEVLTARQAIHERLLETLHSMNDADLARPYSAFAADSRNNQPILGHIMGNTSGHYRKHLTWMKTLVGRE